MEEESGKDQGGARGLTMRGSEFRQAAEVARLAVQLCGNSKKEPECFLDAAWDLIVKARDRVAPPLGVAEGAYQRFEKLGTHEDLEKYIEAGLQDREIPLSALVYSNGRNAKAKIKPKELVDNDGAVYGKWDPMELDNFLYKGLLEGCYKADVASTRGRSFEAYRDDWRKLIESEGKISENRFLFLFSIRYPEEFEAYKKSCENLLEPSEREVADEQRNSTVKKRKWRVRNSDGKFRAKAKKP